MALCLGFLKPGFTQIHPSIIIKGKGWSKITLHKKGREGETYWKFIFKKRLARGLYYSQHMLKRYSLVFFFHSWTNFQDCWWLYHASFSTINELLRLWCLIHNAYLEKILSFCKILRLKITHLKNIFE
jgi:hypothetical protein